MHDSFYLQLGLLKKNTNIHVSEEQFTKSTRVVGLASKLSAYKWKQSQVVSNFDLTKKNITQIFEKHLKSSSSSSPMTLLDQYVVACQGTKPAYRFKYMYTKPALQCRFRLLVSRPLGSCIFTQMMPGSLAENYMYMYTCSQVVFERLYHFCNGPIS